MKTLRFSCLIALLLVCLASCEKDDICVDGDTPLLVIGFFDAQDPDKAKVVPSLRVKEVLLDEVVNTIEDRSSTLDSIGIPLRIDASSTSFAFITNSDDDPITGEETGDVDILTISYQTREVFISRACGFVVHYDALNVTLPGNPNWIQDAQIIQPTVENSNAIHVKLLH